MRGGHVLDDGQAQPGPAGRARAGGVDPVETLEDPLQVTLGDAYPLVRDGDLDHLPGGPAGGHRGGREAEGGAGVSPLAPGH